MLIHKLVKFVIVTAKIVMDQIMINVLAAMQANISIIKCAWQLALCKLMEIRKITNAINAQRIV